MLRRTYIILSFIIFIHSTTILAQFEKHYLMENEAGYSYYFDKLQNGLLCVIHTPWDLRQSDIYIHCFNENLEKLIPPIQLPNYAQDVKFFGLSDRGFFVYFCVDSSRFNNGIFQPYYWDGPDGEFLFCQFFDRNAKAVTDIFQINSKEYASWSGRSIEKPIQLWDGRILFMWDTWVPYGTAGRLLNKSGVFLSAEFRIIDRHWDNAVQISDDQIILFADDYMTNFIYKLEFDVVKEQIFDEFDSYRALKNKLSFSWEAFCELSKDRYLILFAKTDHQEPLNPRYNILGRVVDTSLVSVAEFDLGEYESDAVWCAGLNNGNFICMLEEKNFHDDYSPAKSISQVREQNGKLDFSFYIGLYQNVNWHYLEPMLWNGQLFWIWEEQNPYSGRHSFYVQKFDMITNRPGKICKLDRRFYLPVGKYHNKLCFITEGESGYSKFYAELVPLEPAIRPLVDFKLISPENDITLSDCRPMVHWTPAVSEHPLWLNEVEYKIYVSTDPTFATARTVSVLADTLVRLPLLEKNITYFYKVRAKNIANEFLWCSNINAFFVPQHAVDDSTVYTSQWDNNGELTSVENNTNRNPLTMMLASNYPNPFNPTTTIFFDLPKDGNVNLKIYDVTGRLVRVLVQEHKLAGAHTILWDGLDDAGQKVASGVYLYRIEFVDANGEALVLMRKMSVVK
jgi:hypothetical protein